MTTQRVDNLLEYSQRFTFKIFFQSKQNLASLFVYTVSLPTLPHFLETLSYDQYFFPEHICPDISLILGSDYQIQYLFV